MGKQDVNHSKILTFAPEKVNLPKVRADEYSLQAKRLRKRLDSYLYEDPDFTLKKMLLPGSLATINDEGQIRLCD